MTISEHFGFFGILLDHLGSIGGNYCFGAFRNSWGHLGPLENLRDHSRLYVESNSGGASVKSNPELAPLAP